jgi:mRNA-degrading endonuclease RelE of RelBE toxin-antitoxin system
MVYTLNIDNPAKRVFKRLPRDIRAVLLEKAQVLKDKPLAGEQLKGKYRLLRSLHCSIKGTAYRIIYQIFPSAETIFVRFAGPRENIYRKLDEMKLKP